VAYLRSRDSLGENSGGDGKTSESENNSRTGNEQEITLEPEMEKDALLPEERSFFQDPREKKNPDQKNKESSSSSSSSSSKKKTGSAVVQGERATTRFFSQKNFLLKKCAWCVESISSSKPSGRSGQLAREVAQQGQEALEGHL